MTVDEPAIIVSENDLPNFCVVAPGIYRGGQPSERGFARLKQLGIRSILNLRDERHHIRQEEALLVKLGLQLHSVPLSPFVEPSAEDIQVCLNILKSTEHHPVFVHCLHGQDRTGTIISIYRLDAHGWNINRAYQEMLDLGFHSEFENLTRAVHLYSRLVRPPEPQ